MCKLNFIKVLFYQKWDKTTKYVAMQNTSHPSSFKKQSTSDILNIWKKSRLQVFKNCTQDTVH